jgi:hypothetical protein
MINNLLGWQCENERYQETIRCLHYAEYDGQRECCFTRLLEGVGGDGFEPSKAKPADLQSAPFGHSGIRP